MAKRNNQSDHDNAIDALVDIYQDQHKKFVVTNPGGQKNLSFNGYYIDVIVKNKKEDKEAWLIEVETADSVSKTEAKNQWVLYDEAYKKRWHLAVPKESKDDAKTLIANNKIQHCKIVTWEKNSKGVHTFWGLPGI